MHEQHESSVEFGDLVKSVCFSILGSGILTSFSSNTDSVNTSTAVALTCTDLFSIPSVVKQIGPRIGRINPLLLFSTLTDRQTDACQCTCVDNTNVCTYAQAATMYIAT